MRSHHFCHFRRLVPVVEILREGKRERQTFILKQGMLVKNELKMRVFYMLQIKYASLMKPWILKSMSWGCIFAILI